MADTQPIADGGGGAPAPPPPPPAYAEALFGGPDRLDLGVRYVAMLAGTGTTHGLIGPREVPRLWDRHVLNCAVLAELIEPDSRVIDVGSGAGLPGLVLAIARPDVEVHLVDPLLRRTVWLEQAVGELGLQNVSVHRARAEDLDGVLTAPVVTARAVAALGKLSRWCLPLVEPEGRLLALKGRTADAEAERDRAEVQRAGGRIVQVLTLGAGTLEEPTAVIEVVPDATARRTAVQDRPGRSRKRARRSRMP